MRQLALVTGASAGIGRSIAADLASRGYDIVGVGSSAKVEDLASELTQTVVHPVRADLSTREGVDQVWREVEALDRPLEVAALNAGRSLGGGFLDTDIEEELVMIALNITSQVLLAKHVTRRMSEQGHGGILITSSLSALTPTPYESIYGPTRAFMLSFAEGLREEMKEHGVTVTALLPGATATDFHHSAGMDNTVFGNNDWKNDPGLVARQGVDALMAGKDHVVGGDAKTRRSALLNRVLPDSVKARRFAKSSRPTP
ncbi:SDR family NAD(P)-dependent oxidoreductase [Marihabitans asiaticum]|uniref:Short-subunit dehydrogenase n=1 Tax=Marihabitans asiaticum TaxID=415218 RepID=A0A560WEL0_9MICO|nr:SDR family NAD(P)-dependent oxidoreductase [Marihabitans asiaticum]TWD15960.1 short-subunit dehydrogenase [Marihabitans asiaticum]